MMNEPLVRVDRVFASTWARQFCSNVELTTELTAANASWAQVSKC